MSELQKILHVEDDPDIQAIVAMALQVVGGLTVKTCSSGAEALREAEQFAPDLFLLDVMMPEMDGPSLLKALYQIPGLSKVPAVFLTAKVQAHEVSFYRSIGAMGVIKKPFDPMTLASELNTIWVQSQR